MTLHEPHTPTLSGSGRTVRLRPALRLAGLLAGLLATSGCAGLLPSWTDAVTGAEARLVGPVPERVSVGGLQSLLGARTRGDQLVRDLFMAELAQLGLVQDELEPQLRFVGDLALSSAHEPLGGHDAFLVLAAYVPGDERAVWWCRVYREYDVYARTDVEIAAVLKQAAQLFAARLELWRGS